MKTKHIIVILTFLFSAITSCREPFETESIEFLDALVVESTITNELKHQEVKLSRTYKIDADDPIIENNATVTVQDSNDNIYTFSQDQNGIYQSDVAFEAQENISYQLSITTQDGKIYQSNSVPLTPISDITNLYAETTTRNDGNFGVQVMVDSDNSNSSAQYFRYEYEETFKVVAPNWNLYDAILTNFFTDPIGGAVEFDTEFVVRSQEEQICYVSNESSGIIQISTSDLNDNFIVGFPIRFISETDGILRDRYSVLVRQYVQNLEAYTFYDIVNQLGDNESILTQNQPGYILGNVASISNPNERVIGFFEVCSVSEKRIFFDYLDFNLPRPDYISECQIIELDYNLNYTCGTCNPPISNERVRIYNLLTRFQEENYNYHIMEVPQPIESIWRITNPECGDCTTLGSNIEPDFWED